MGWLLLAGLVIMWAAFLLPKWRGSSSRQSVKDFDRNMDLLADTEGQGRWIVTPRKGMTFMGPRARAQVRARERRRRILVVLVESLALTAFIGLVPPLRAMWYVAAVLLVLLGIYVWLLLSMKAKVEQSGSVRAREAVAPSHERARRHRYAGSAAGRTARPSWGGMPAFGEDLASVVVRPARQAGAARV